MASKDGEVFLFEGLRVRVVRSFTIVGPTYAKEEFAVQVQGAWGTGNAWVTFLDCLTERRAIEAYRMIASMLRDFTMIPSPEGHRLVRLDGGE